MNPSKADEGSNSHYYVLYLLLHVFIFVDIFVNSTIDIDDYSPISLCRSNGFCLLLRIIGTSLQVIIVIVLGWIVFLMVSTTYLYKAGLLPYITKRIPHIVLVTVLYFVTSAGAGAFRLVNFFVKKPSTVVPLWDVPFFSTVFMIHRLMGLVFYYFYFLSAFRLEDPELYQKEPWIEKFQDH